MAKEFNLEKIKTQFDNIPLGEAIEHYHELGEFLHQKIEKQREEANKLSEQLSKSKTS